MCDQKLTNERANQSTGAAHKLDTVTVNLQPAEDDGLQSVNNRKKIDGKKNKMKTRCIDDRVSLLRQDKPNPQGPLLLCTASPAQVACIKKYVLGVWGVGGTK